MNFENINKNQEEKEIGGKKITEKKDIQLETGEKEEKPQLSELDDLNPDSLDGVRAEKVNNKIASKEYIEDPELLIKIDQFEAGISQEIIKKQLSDAERYKGKKGIFEKLKQNKTFKIASKVVLAYMILFKANAAFGNDQVEQDKVKDLKAVEFVDDNLGGDGDNNLEDNTFEMSASDLEDVENEDGDKTNKAEVGTSENLESNNFEDSKASVLDIDQYFGNNEAEISQEGQDQALGHTLNFFSDMAGEDGEIDRDKLRDFMDNEIKIKASANELSRVGGNEELSIDRGEALKSILTSEDSLEKISNHLSELGLSDDEVDSVLEKFTNAKIEIPHSDTGEEAGVTYITDMENPDTGNNYTAQEVEDMKTNNPDKYNKLLAEARSVKIDLSAEPDNLHGLSSLDAQIDNQLVIETLEKITPKLSEIANFQEVLIASDNSPSTIDDNKSMIAQLETYFKDLKRSATEYKLESIKVASFSDDMSGVSSYGTQEAEKAFSQLYEHGHQGNSNEKAVDAALKLVDKADSEKSSVCYINTDELLQNLSLNELEALKEKCQEKKVELKFLLKPDKLIDQNGQEVKSSNPYVEASLSEVEKSLLSKMSSNFEKVDEVYKNASSQTQLEKKAERLEALKDYQQYLKEIEFDNGIKATWKI
ncbi:MAG: hypothetical protein K9M44_01765 [Candidatus Pacebacteria bacterium]|nr:hypothetical protein [Candidatus Paceibacterota bacterium]